MEIIKDFKPMVVLDYYLKINSTRSYTKRKSSFIVSGRRTYIDVLAQPFMNEENAFSGSGYYFYDLTTKVITIIR